MTVVEASAVGDPIPSNCAVIEVRVGTLPQLFNTIDPTPFRERDLDPRVVEFIVDWSHEIPRKKSLALLVHLDQPTATGDESVIVRDAVHGFFEQSARTSRARLRQLFRRGRISLAIGLTVLAVLILVAQFVARRAGETGFASILHESLLIGGWVAMWRPLEVFLYDWWPIMAEARRFDQLATMPVRLSYDQRRSAKPG
jgi:hypothetical protein